MQRIPKYVPEQMDRNVQVALLALLSHSTKFGVEVALTVPADLYDVGPHREIAKAVVHYRLRYHKAPSTKQLAVLVEGLPLAQEQIKVARLLAAKFEEHMQGMNKEFMVEQARVFAIRQNFKKAALDAATEANKPNGDNEIVRKIIYDAMMYSPDTTDLGINLGDAERSLAWLGQKDIVWPLGIEPFDRHAIGLVPKGLVLYLAGKNTGKSWACIHVGREMMKQKRKVLHITLEMSDLKVAKRYHMVFNGLSRTMDKYTTVDFKRDNKGNVVGLDPRLVRPRLAETSRRLRETLERRMITWHEEFEGLRIKEYPSGKLRLSQLIHYLDQLANVDGFKPDVIILDYPDLMDLPTTDQRIALGKLFVDLRAVAVEQEAAMFAPSQINRAGMNAEQVRSVHTSEAMLKVNTADTVLTYSQTPGEKAIKLARLYANHVRDAENDIDVLISQAYGIGQFVTEATIMNKELRELVLGEAKETEAEAAAKLEPPAEESLL